MLEVFPEQCRFFAFKADTIQIYIYNKFAIELGNEYIAASNQRPLGIGKLLISSFLPSKEAAPVAMLS